VDKDNFTRFAKSGACKIYKTTGLGNTNNIETIFATVDIPQNPKPFLSKDKKLIKGIYVTDSQHHRVSEMGP
jgi:hypothetical protein